MLEQLSEVLGLRHALSIFKPRYRHKKPMARSSSSLGVGAGAEDTGLEQEMDHPPRLPLHCACRSD